MKKGLFKPRVNILPYDYPELLQYKEAIRHSYWIDTEYNFTTDINDFKVKVTEEEREVIKRAMLAIAQVEVNVKTFWADMYKRMPITEIGDVGMTFAECHVDGTEVLTPKGWVDFRDINVGDDVVQYDIESKQLSVTKVNKVIVDDYEGDMIRFSNNKLDAIVTPNHRIIYQDSNGNVSVILAKDISSISESNIPKISKLYNFNGLNELSWMDRLKIAINLYGVPKYYKTEEKLQKGLNKNDHIYVITLEKDSKKIKLVEILLNSNISYKEYPVEGNDNILYEINLGDDYFDYRSFDWVRLSNKSHGWCEGFINELSFWSDSVIDNETIYSTKRKSCANRVQAVAVSAGFECNITYDNDGFLVSILKHLETNNSKINKEFLPYSGKVYCINVDSGAILTRYNDTTFISGNSEVRHKDAYARLLRLLGLEDEFQTVIEIPAIMGRISYLTKYLDGTRSSDDKMYTKSILLFSLFIEHVSLFSQFLIMMSFNKEKNLFKGISNVVEATSKEEDIHGNFGSEIINIIKRENPEWFDDEFENLIYSASKKAYEAECKILDWIFEKGELDFLPKKTIQHFIMGRFNNSLKRIGMNPAFDVDEKELEKTKWFELETTSTKEGDFFYKRQVDYTKKQKPITEDDLF